MKYTLSQLISMFDSQVTTSHITYGWDGGHCYSYIDHPLLRDFEDHISGGDCDDFMDYTNEWLYENDDCPPCEISIIDGVVSSRCGCHDGLDYVKDREVIDDIISTLMRVR